MTNPLTILPGDALEQLQTLPENSVQMCVTSPPYWGLRRYGDSTSELGQEKTPEDYIASMVKIFTEVYRVLREDGVLWLNIGDSYARNPGKGIKFQGGHNAQVESRQEVEENSGFDVPPGMKPKDLVGIPWMLAFALRSKGWYLRSDIIWAKPNCMPESVRDRPTRSHEYLFLLSKSERYYYDHEAIMEPCSESFLNDSRHKTGPTDKNVKNGYDESKAQNPKAVHRLFDKQRGHSRRHQGFNERWDNMEKSEQCSGMRNKRDVWWISPAQYREAHYATFPKELITPCILAGSKPGDIVLDPFGGSGTTGEVALELGRKAILIELYEKNVQLINQRTQVTMGLF